ncbi:MAG: GAF domain-containing protein [Cytophagales bacterium]|nr:GAF domain-containing protein [Cytophagales bacterium]
MKHGLFDLGTAFTSDIEEKHSVRLANQLGFFTLMLMGIYAVFSLGYYPGLGFLPGLVALAGAATLLLNMLGHTTASRLVLSLAPMLGVSLYHAAIVNPGEPPLTSLHLSLLCFSLYPWVLFDLRQAWVILLCTSVGVVLGTAQPELDSRLLGGVESTTFRQGSIFWITYALGTAVAVASLLSLLQKNERVRRENTRLIHDLRSRNQQLEELNREFENQSERLMHFSEETLRHTAELDEQRALLEDKNKRMTLYSRYLLDLSRDSGVQSGNLNEALSTIVRVLHKSNIASRVSIWWYEERYASLKCLAAINSDEYLHPEPVSIDLNQFPNYHQAIRSEEPIVATEALAHPATIDFAELLLIPHNIHSMLDIPFFIEGKLRGVVCCEHQGEQKTWTPEDQFFVKAVGDVIALAFGNTETRRQHQDISTLNEEITAQNEELMAQREEIIAINESLEKQVQERTEALAKQNAQLEEYAFINSHLLRKPITNIQSLLPLLEYPNNLNRGQLIHLLKISVEELDHMVHNINLTIQANKEMKAEKEKK